MNTFLSLVPLFSTAQEVEVGRGGIKDYFWQRLLGMENWKLLGNVTHSLTNSLGGRKEQLQFPNSAILVDESISPSETQFPHLNMRTGPSPS